MTDNKNPLADFAFKNLPTELLVEIFKHARPDNVEHAHNEEFLYPLALTQVCNYWRTVALEAPTLWTNIRIMDFYTEQTQEAASMFLERSKSCPLFLTWFSKPGQTNVDAQEVIDRLIIPYAERWQRITLIASNEVVPDALFAVMGPLDFPILQDVEISCLPAQSPPPKLALCRNAPNFRRYRLRNISSLPPLPSNLVVFDCVTREPLSPDPLLEFLPHVAHSLEHLRLGPSTSEVSATSRRSKILLQNLKSLLVKDSHIIVNCILTPNLIHFAVVHPPDADAQKAAQMFNGFSAPKLQLIRFHRTPLLPLLTSHNLPSIFPQLESVVLLDCIDESAFAPLLELPQPMEPSSLQKAPKYPPKHRKVENPFPKLEELVISDVKNWTSLQAAIEKRLKNGDSSLRKIQMPKEEVPETIVQHLTRWLPKQGIELILYKREFPILAPPEFQDDFSNEEFRLFSDIMDELLWNGDDEHYDFDYGDDIDYHPDYENFYGEDSDYEIDNDFYGDFDDEEEEYYL